MDDYLTRSRQLIGENNLNSLASKKILLVGLGGVGGGVFIALIRSGFKNIYVVDGDKVEISNLNRQILFDKTMIGKSKIEIAKEYANKIDLSIKIEAFNFFINEETIKNFDDVKFDVIIDAIDDCKGKLELAKLAERQNAHFISSLGTGNRIDLTSLKITTLDKTSDDPLARKFRTLARKASLDLKKLNVVFSTDKIVSQSSAVSSMIFVPLTAGVLIAQYIMKLFIVV